MPLIDVMRYMATEQGMSDDDFAITLSAYIEAGTMTNDERRRLVAMTYEQRVKWLMNKRYPPDALRAVILDFDAWGFITPTGLARFWRLDG